MSLFDKHPIAPMSTPEPGVDNSAPAPGKRTLTEQLAAKVKQQEKQVCDDPNLACFFDATTRGRLDADINANIIGAMTAWSAALAAKRTDLISIAGHKQGWGTLWKIGGVLAMAGLGFGVGAGIEFLGEAAESVNAIQAAAAIVNREEIVHGVFDFVGEQVIDKVKDHVAEAAGESDSAKADFLTSQLDGPHVWGTQLLKAFPKQLDDYGRLLLLCLTEPKVMSFQAFTHQINLLLERWQKQAGDVGENRGPWSIETVAWIYPHGSGKPRLARISTYAPPKAAGGERLLIAENFRQWVDDDMVPYAIEELNRRELYVHDYLTLDKVAGAPSDPQTLAWDRGAPEPATVASGGAAQ